VKGDCFVLKKTIKNNSSIFNVRGAAQWRDATRAAPLYGDYRKEGVQLGSCQNLQLLPKNIASPAIMDCRGMKSLSAVGCRRSEQEGLRILLSNPASFGVRRYTFALKSKSSDN
jgi:hypothetical protein